MAYRAEFDERGRSRPRKSLGFGFLLLSVFALLGVLVFPTPYVVEQPGPAYDVLGKSSEQSVISITGAKTYPTTGNLDLLTVQVLGNRERTPNWLQIFSAWLDPAKSVEPIDAVFPANQTAEESTAESTAMMEQSQQTAIAVALTKLGYQVPVELYVSEVTKSSPASGKIVAADFVKSVDGLKVTTIEQLREKVNLYDGTKPITLIVSRDNVEKSFELTPVKDESGAYRVGILVGYRYEFPVNIELQLGDVGGPSGGMIFALGIYDRLTPGNLLGNNHVAGTGTISETGQVGPVGGIRQKLFGASQAGAKHFLSPSDNCGEVIGNIPDGLQVFRVKTFDEALTAVEKIGKGQDLSQLPMCTTN